MGHGEQHGETGEDGEQGVDNQAEAVNHLVLLLLSSSGPGQVPGQVQKVQGLRTKDLDLG